MKTERTKTAKKPATATRKTTKEHAMPAKKSPKSTTESPRTQMTIEMVKSLKGDELLQAHELVLGTAAKPKTPAPVLRSRIIAELERRDAAAPATDAATPAADESMPLDEALAESPAAAANAASWDAALPEPGYTPPAGTGDESAAASDDGDESEPASEPADDAAAASASATRNTDDAPASDTGATEDAPATKDAIDLLIDRARGMEPATLDAFLGATPKKELHATLERLTGEKTSGRLGPASAIARIKQALAPEQPAAADTDGARAEGEPAQGGADAEPSADAKAASEDKALPPIGTVIQKKDRHGKVRAECKVVEGGIEYGGKVHSSLSAAAVAAARDLGLTTKTLNGWVWWQLASTPRPTRTSATKGIDFESLEKAWDRYRERAEAASKNVGADEREKLQAMLSGHSTALLGLNAAASEPATEAA